MSYFLLLKLYHVGEVNHKRVDNHRLTGIRGLMMLTPN